MKNIFKKLNEKNICYAVGIAITTFKSKGSGLRNKDYYIIAAKHNSDKLKGLRFKNGADAKRHTTLERDLEREEVRVFKSMLDDFVKVEDCDDGRVYELKTNSFKSYYKTIQHCTCDRCVPKSKEDEE